MLSFQKPQILLLAGEVTSFRNDTDRELAFRQESNFYYLSGCTIPSSFLLAAYQPGTSLSITPSVELFIPKVEPEDLMWTVPPPTLDEAKKNHDVTDIDHTAALPAAIERLIKALPGALFHTLPRNSPLFPILPEEYTQQVLSLGGAVTDLYLLPALHQTRLTKDADEIAAIKHANEISSRAHEVVMRVLGKAVKGKIQAEAGVVKRPLLPGEWLIEKEVEAEAIFVASCRREGSVYRFLFFYYKNAFYARSFTIIFFYYSRSVHQAYLPVVAASTRASILHYCCNDREFAWGPLNDHHHNTNGLTHGPSKEFIPQVLLIDAGCEWDCYASDITRTMPVGNGGKFTPEARAIYELVLEMQKVNEDCCFFFLLSSRCFSF